MALQTKYNDTQFGVGDTVRVVQKIKEGEKERLQAFEGIVLKIKGEGENKTFTVRRIGAQKIGIERIFPLNTPTLDSVEVVRKGKRGTRRAKLYYIRDKSTREIERIYSRDTRRRKAKGMDDKKEEKVKKTSTKTRTKASKKTSKKRG